MASQKVYYVAVHGGAGQHGKTSEAQVKDAMKRACTEALRTTADLPRVDAISMVERAISILEDDDCLNAGYGANLTFDGTVECDAALMDGQTGDFGSVGALSGIRHPIKAARAVLAHARVPDALGRIRPLTLVASGAHAFAHRNGIDLVDPADMVAPRARRDWARWRQRYDDAAAFGPLVSDRRDADTATASLRDDGMQDTVGAVAWDSEGNLAAGVSSGGLLLKYAGRIGEAAAFGAGCWAEQSREGRTGMACSISGTGEHIMRVGLARTIADVLRPSSDPQDSPEADVHDLLSGTLSTRFHVVAHGNTHPNVGVLLMTKETRGPGNIIPRLWCAFTTESMAVAYASSERVTPRV